MGTVNNVRIPLRRALINPFAKLFPSKAEVEAGYFLIALRDANGDKIPDGIDANGYTKYKYEPALDADGNKIPVPVNPNTGKSQPYIKDMRTLGNSKIDEAIKSRARVDINLPNEDVDSNLRKRNITVPMSFLTEDPKYDGYGYVLTVRAEMYRDGIKVNAPKNPYRIGTDGTRIEVEPEYRNYIDKDGNVSKKLMVPIGFDANNRPVWDDGTKAVLKEGSPKCAEFDAVGKSYVTFKTAVKYDYSDSRMPIDELSDVLVKDLMEHPPAPGWAVHRSAYTGFAATWWGPNNGFGEAFGVHRVNDLPNIKIPVAFAESENPKSMACLLPPDSPYYEELADIAASAGVTFQPDLRTQTGGKYERPLHEYPISGMWYSDVESAINESERFVQACLDKHPEWSVVRDDPSWYLINVGRICDGNGIPIVSANVGIGVSKDMTMWKQNLMNMWLESCENRDLEEFEAHVVELTTKPIKDESSRSAGYGRRNRAIFSTYGSTISKAEELTSKLSEEHGVETSY